MTTSGALDLGISLFFVYLLTSLLCTSACELIASLLSMRGRMLFDAVGTLLGNEKLRQAVFEHPLLKGISHGKSGRPSYVPRELFAAAALDVLAKSDASVTNDLREALLAMTRGTKAEAKLTIGFAKLDEDALEVKAALGKWFDESMARAAGAYKRHSQRVVFLVAAVLVVGLNIDTVAIARTLWLRPELRSAIAEQAANYVAQPTNAPSRTTRDGALNSATGTPPSSAAGTPNSASGTATTGTATTGTPTTGTATTDQLAAFAEANARLETTTETLAGLGLPLGWPDPRLDATLWDFLSKLVGWLITILACSLGAPFWFDLLAKLVNIRSTGRKPT